VIAALTVSAAPKVPDRPRSVRVFVDSTGITPTDNGSQTSPDRTKVWARAGGNFAIVVENLDTVAHTVTVPIDEFGPATRPNGAARAPDKAQNGQPDKLPLVNGPPISVTVEPVQVGVLLLKVQPAANFGFDKLPPWANDKSLGRTYTYTIHSHPEGKPEVKPLDPDVEITPP